MDGGRDTMTLCIDARLGAEGFYKPGHRMIYKAMSDLYGDGQYRNNSVYTNFNASQDKPESLMELNDVLDFGGTHSPVTQYEFNAFGDLVLEKNKIGVRGNIFEAHFVKQSVQITFGFCVAR